MWAIKFYCRSIVAENVRHATRERRHIVDIVLPSILAGKDWMERTPQQSEENRSMQTFLVSRLSLISQSSTLDQ